VKLNGYVVAILSIFALLLAGGCISSHDGNGNNVKPVENNGLDPAIHQQIENALNASGYQSHVATNLLAPRIHDITGFGIEATKGPVKITGTATSIDQVKEAIADAQDLEDRNFTDINIEIPSMKMTVAKTTSDVAISGSATSIGQVDEAIKLSQALEAQNLTNIEISMPGMTFKATGLQVSINSDNATSIERIDETMGIIQTLRSQNLTGINLDASTLSFSAQLGNTTVDSAGANNCTLSSAFCDDVPYDEGCNFVPVAIENCVGTNDQGNGNLHFDPVGGVGYKIAINDQGNSMSYSLDRQAQLIKQKLAGKVNATVTLMGAYFILDSGKRVQILSEADQERVSAINVTYCTKITTVAFPISEISKNRAGYNADFAANNIDFSF